MLNQSAEYALRATLYMAAQGSRKAYKATALAEALGVPPNYLSKILHALVRTKVLTSERGPTGGYRLAVAPSRLPLERAISPFQELKHRGPCLLGDRACNHNDPCAAHQRWGQMTDVFMSFIRNTTLADMLVALPPAETTGSMTEVA